MNILTKIFGEPEEINGANRCPTYLYRWFLLQTRWFKVYLHHFVGDDWSLDLHDHPKRFVSIGLWGWYIEETPYKGGAEWGRLGPARKTFRAPWIRTFPAEHIHRLSVPNKNCWTLIIVGRGSRPWGFWHKGEWIPFLDYVRGKDGIADKMKACE